jgi:hypothetical protein
VLSKGLVEGVLVDGERKVANEKDGSGLVGLVTVAFSTLLGVWWGTGSSVVHLDGTAVDLLAVEGDGGSGSIEVGKLDVTETTRTVVLTVNHDTGLDDLTALGKLGCEPVVVDVP